MHDTSEQSFPYQFTIDRGMQVDGNNSVAFRCIVSTDCTHGYKNRLLDLVLSPKLKERVNDRIFRNDLAEAGLDNTWCDILLLLNVIT